MNGNLRAEVVPVLQAGKTVRCCGGQWAADSRAAMNSKQLHRVAEDLCHQPLLPRLRAQEHLFSWVRVDPHSLTTYCALLQWRFLVSIIVASIFGVGFMAAILGYARHKRLLFIPTPVSR